MHRSRMISLNGSMIVRPEVHRTVPSRVRAKTKCLSGEQTAVWKIESRTQGIHIRLTGISGEIGPGQSDAAWTKKNLLRALQADLRRMIFPHAPELAVKELIT